MKFKSIKLSKSIDKPGVGQQLGIFRVTDGFRASEGFDLELIAGGMLVSISRAGEQVVCSSMLLESAIVLQETPKVVPIVTPKVVPIVPVEEKPAAQSEKINKFAPKNPKLK